MDKIQKKVKILDCTIRDGGYVNNWHFDEKMVREVYRNLSKSGVDYVELGFRGTRKYFDPEKYGIWRFSPEEKLQKVTTGIQGAKISIMGDFGKLDLEDLNDRKDSIVTMIRLAVHKDRVFDAVAQLEKIKGKGYVTSLQAMGFTGYTDQEKDDLKRALKDSVVDYFYIADSYGSIMPDEIESLFDPFKDIGQLKLGFHPHNSLQMAFANTLEAIKTGVDIIDGSIYGMGRGSGNLPTEIMLSYLSVHGDPKYNVIPVLNAVERYFVDIMQKKPWGYQLPYMVSGMFKCHPYYAAELIKRKEYSIEDIWKALEVIEEMNPVGFKPDIIETMIKNGVVGSLGKKAFLKNKVIDNQKEKFASHPAPYIGRHAGRDFLILANGPGLKENREKIKTFIAEYNPVVMGANYLADLFEPQYHAFTSKKRFTMYAETVSLQSEILIGENIPEETVDEYLNRDFEWLFFEDILDADFGIKNGRIKTNCRTVSVLLAGIAVVMGANRIFIAGMDGYLNKQNIQKTLFYNEKFEPEEYKLNLERHHWNERFLHQINQYIQRMGKEGLHILTPTSHQAFYTGIDNYLQL